MLRSTIFACCVFVIPAGAQASPEAFPISAPALIENWNTYLADADCRGPALEGLLMGLQVRMDAAKGMLVADQIEGSTDGLESVLKNAAAYNAIGQAALDKGCPDVAREMFLTVIDTFQGEAYASARDRAKIGIDDARVAE